MKRILKYKLPRDGETKTIEACVLRWLAIKEQDGWPHIWAVVDDCGPARSYGFIAWGTGWDYPEELNDCEYMGTAIDGMGYVWHYFMEDNTYSSLTTTTLEYDPAWNKLQTTACPLGIDPYSVTISCGDPNGIGVINSPISTIDYNLAEEIAERIRSTAACSKTQ